jgi:signal transduction histidine kinase
MVTIMSPAIPITRDLPLRLSAQSTSDTEGSGQDIGQTSASRFFEEVTSYVGFRAEDSILLREFASLAEPHLERIADHFYARILDHPQAHEAITGGPDQIARLKPLLVDWMRSGLVGPHDAEFCHRRARIGHVHVRIGLPQRYMVTAMSVMRLEFLALANRSFATSGGGDLEHFGHLLIAINRLYDIELAVVLETYKLEADDRLRRRERLATIGHLAACIGHDLRNPLSVIESSLYILRRRISDDPRALKHVQKISHQIEECDGIITHLLEMARNQPPRRELVSGGVLLDAAITSAQIPQGFSLERNGFADLQLWVDGGLVKQALVNLLLNSVQAQSGAGTIRVDVRVDGVDVTIAVSDSGPGFAANSVPRVFEPLVTTKPSGTGLGLALVKSVTERHGGHVSAANRAEGGAVVELHLPGAAPDLSSVASPNQS